MTTKQQIDKLIKQLRSVHARPSGWMEDDMPAIANFMYGVIAACRALDIDYYGRHEGMFRQAIATRGWNPSDQPLWRQLAEAGLSSEEIQKEILAVYLDTTILISKEVLAE